MNDKNFVTVEEVSAKQNNIKTLIRFAGSLSLLHKLMAPTLLVMFFAAAIPPYFLWFVGEMLGCFGEASCSVTHEVLSREVVVPATLSTLVMLVLLAMFCRISAWMLFELSGQWSTQNVHRDLMQNMSKVRTTFYDENPSGRLLNRMLSDWGMLRLEGVMSYGDTVSGLIEVLCVGALIMVANPVAGLLIIPAVICYVALQAQLAPMMSHAREIRSVKIGETLHRETDLIEGRTIFKLYNTQENLLERIHKAFGDSMNIQLFYARLMAWGMLWMGLISAVYAIVVYGFLVYGLHAGLITTTLAAVIITAVFNLNSLFFNLAWDMSFLGETASHARRVFFMIDLPNETAEESKALSVRPIVQDVDLKGDIVFDNYAMSYRPGLPRILDGLSLRIPESQKVGIVGRTGAGKSSLMQAMFRMVHHQAGDIRIGEQSLFDVDVNCVRSHFGVVPQDPYLFMGDIRFNLKGDMDVSDDEMRAVLRTVGLNVSLDARVLEGGRDYSVGERQLLCIARLILLDKKIILMDEPTSALDRKTDEMIQRLMRTVLAKKTVITIAHRLESLERYDLILEMKNGRLLRQGSPRQMMPNLQDQFVA
ncbi:MAG: ABC transporter ATP-binding protein/permease [Pseudomonadales bacterium]|nr:ABC transporter ATP-binding protein/permease [Pseudomonadales bacterium]MBO6596227.1 ABC transporter ATP-binding protein/permease [Pseudomonadales bacterium]MBO6702838.1 ABC transporter ATP-binding protein/permease [Pseudomonadales bacterium]MBO6822707.1 ABC transporter ATP-binding protein/permease [Pseudomonadales bacterium]MBO7005259.1 ABC transporter ATP-binding protein/permease [Pseudomonadales bacterium]